MHRLENHDILRLLVRLHLQKVTYTTFRLLVVNTVVGHRPCINDTSASFNTASISTPRVAFSLDERLNPEPSKNKPTSGLVGPTSETDR